MSSSKKKQLRNEQYMTERQAAAAAEAKKLKRYTLTFWVVVALVACIFIGSVASKPINHAIYKHTDAVQIGDHKLSATELNYFYIDAINDYYSSYSSLIAYGLINLKTGTPLNEQNQSEGVTWADYMLEYATSIMRTTYSRYDAAIAASHELTDSEKKEIDTTLSTFKLYAKANGYSSLTAYLRAIYGSGASESSYRKYLEVSALANSYYNAYYSSLNFTDEDLDKYQANAPYTYNSYTYASYYLGYSAFENLGTEGKDGKVTFTDEQKALAAAAAKEKAEQLAAGNYASVDELDLAIKEIDKQITGKETSSALATRSEDVLFTDSNMRDLFKYWLAGYDLNDGVDINEATFPEDYTKSERSEGDMVVLEYASGTGDSKVINGYYILRYESETSNDFALKNVRHLLVKFDAKDKDKVTGEEKATAKAAAAKLLAQWEAGKKTEDSFAELVNKESDDTGSNTNGGLYEDIYPGQMLTAFEDWCYDDNRQVGDYDIIETTVGYHIMYFVGNSDTTYRSYLINAALLSETISDWSSDLFDATKLEILTEKYVNKGITIGS